MSYAGTSGDVRHCVRNTFIEVEEDSDGNVAPRSQSLPPALGGAAGRSAAVLAVFDTRVHTPEARRNWSLHAHARARPSRQAQEVLKFRLIRFEEINASCNVMEMWISRFKVKAPWFEQIASQVAIAIGGLLADECAASIVMKRAGDGKYEDIGIVYVADLTKDGLIVFDCWVYPEHCSEDTFTELGRWWIISLFSKYSPSRHAEVNPCLQYEKVTICYPLPNAMFRPVAQQVLEGFCFEAASDNVTQRLKQSLAIVTRNLNTHSWMQWGPFTQSELKQKADELWPRKPFPKCSDIARELVAPVLRRPCSPSREASSSKKMRLPSPHEEPSAFGTIKVTPSKFSGRVSWDDEQNALNLDVCFTCAEQWKVPVRIAQSDPECRAYAIALASLWTRVQASQMATLGPDREISKILSREVVLHESNARQKMEEAPNSDPPEWGATVQVVPKRQANADLLAMPAVTQAGIFFDSGVQVECRLMMPNPSGEEIQVGSISCIPDWTYQLAI